MLHPSLQFTYANVLTHKVFSLIMYIFYARHSWTDLAFGLLRCYRRGWHVKICELVCCTLWEGALNYKVH